MDKRLNALVCAARIICLLALGSALAGCVIQSKQQLVSAGEAVAALPLTVWLTGYEAAEGGVKKGSDAPMKLTFKDTLYTSSDNSFQVRFVALDRPDTYLADIIEAAEGHVYGIARYRNNVLVLNALIAETDLDATLAKERELPGGDVLRDITVSEGALILTQRSELDRLVEMALAGRLTLSPFVLYISEFADAQAPATLVPDGEFWKAP